MSFLFEDICKVLRSFGSSIDQIYNIDDLDRYTEEFEDLVDESALQILELIGNEQ